MQKSQHFQSRRGDNMKAPYFRAGVASVEELKGNIFAVEGGRWTVLGVGSS